MQRQMLKSKIHRATITACDADYVGSVSIGRWNGGVTNSTAEYRSTPGGFTTRCGLDTQRSFVQIAMRSPKDSWRPPAPRTT